MSYEEVSSKELMRELIDTMREYFKEKPNRYEELPEDIQDELNELINMIASHKSKHHSMIVENIRTMKKEFREKFVSNK